MIPSDFTPIQNPEMVAESVKDFSYTGVHRWFDLLDSTFKQSDTYAVFHDLGTVPDYTAHLHENTIGMGVSVFFKSPIKAQSDVHITAKQILGSPSSDYTERDIEPLPVDALRWKRQSMHQVDLVKLFVEVRKTTRPTLKVARIALVRAGVNLSVMQAESALQDIGRLITITSQLTSD